MAALEDAPPSAVPEAADEAVGVDDEARGHARDVEVPQRALVEPEVVEAGPAVRGGGGDGRACLVDRARGEADGARAETVGLAVGREVPRERIELVERVTARDPRSRVDRDGVVGAPRAAPRVEF